MSSPAVPSTATPAGAPADGKAKASRRRSSILTDDQQKALEKRIQNRPDQAHVKAQGIVKEGGRFAAQSAKLQREMAADAIARAIDSRPTREELMSGNVLDSIPVAAKLQATAKKLERSMIANHLSQKLYSRDADELHKRNLFRGDDVAPRLRSAKIKLEHAFKRDQLGRALEARREPTDLVAHNIAQSMTVSSRIQAAQKKLQHHMTIDKIGHALEKRSEIEDLQRMGILQDTRVAPRIQGVQKKLERQIARANLYHALKGRAELDELKRRGIYRDREEDSEADGDDEEDDEEDEYYGSSAAPVEEKAYEPTGYQRRSKYFHLTRILLKFVASMAEAGDISLQQKGVLKDLIVDQDKTILAVAETFDAENDVNDMKDSLVRLAASR